ncbi:MAG: hypothetical protein RL742_1160, partial [Bacteroidota bacterium]
MLCTAQQNTIWLLSILSETELIKGCLRGKAHCQRQLYELFAGKMYA